MNGDALPLAFVEQAQEQLPVSMLRLIDVVGLPAVIALVREYGGTGVFIPLPENIHGTHRVAELIGLDNMRRLAELHGREYLEIPLCKQAMRAARNADIAAKARNGWSQAEIARHYGLTLRAVSMIINSPIDDRQVDLFER